MTPKVPALTPDLMMPRYKVVASYPGSNWKVGQVIELNLIGEDKRSDSYYAYTNEDGAVDAGSFDNWPDIFRKLQWWEEREEKDMPEYVKDRSAIPSVIRKIEKHFIMYLPNGMRWDEEAEDIGSFITDEKKCYRYVFFSPATPEEYTQYLNQNQKP